MYFTKVHLMLLILKPSCCTVVVTLCLCTMNICNQNYELVLIQVIVNLLRPVVKPVGLCNVKENNFNYLI